MQSPAALRIDPRPVAQVVATMLQAFRRAGVRLPPPPPAASPAYEKRLGPGNPSPKAGLHLPAPQSTLKQVRQHQESTERQYALREKALQLGWPPERILILDRDLGISGTQMANRPDFQHLVAEVSLQKVGAVFALEASRLSRSDLDWHRLVDLCGWTSTLLIDEDGAYNPGDFNDRLLLGLKGTMSQAELHFLRVRLQGGKLSKARKGQLRFPLPVGFVYAEPQGIVLDPDQEVQGAVRLVFTTFGQTASAYGVVQHFAEHQLLFPKRSYGRVWHGQLRWSRLNHGRVLCLLRNPAYAGAYVFGRYRSCKSFSPTGQMHHTVRPRPLSRLASESAQPTSRLHHLGGIPGQPAEAGAEPNQ